MTDYTNIVNDLLSINDTMFAIGTSNKNIDTISIRIAFDKNWHNIAERAAAAIEALQAQLPKLGEWIEDTITYAGPGLSNYKCSLCGKICGTWRRGLEPSELPNWCGNCGADMRAKMEVSE